MIVLSYDISDDKLRRNFSKFLEQFGHRIQYSVFEIDNSDAIIDNIITEIDNKFRKRFTENDSIMVWKIKHDNDIIKYGFSRHDDEDIIII